MAMSILPKFLTLKWNFSRTIWRIEVGDGSFCCIFDALSFDRRFPLNSIDLQTKLNPALFVCIAFCIKCAMSLRIRYQDLKGSLQVCHFQKVPCIHTGTVNSCIKLISIIFFTLDLRSLR